MTVTTSIDPGRLLEEQLAQASPDLLRDTAADPHQHPARRRGLMFEALTGWGYHVFRPEGTFYLWERHPLVTRSRSPNGFANARCSSCRERWSVDRPRACL